MNNNSVQDYPRIGLNIDETVVRGDEPARCRINRDYIDAVAEAGGIPILIPPMSDRRLLRCWISMLDGIVFTGGADYPPHLYGQDAASPKLKIIAKRRAHSDIELAGLVFHESTIPVLGICLGHQLISVAHGGKLIQHLDDARSHRSVSAGEDREHEIAIAPRSRLAKIFCADRIVVNSSHHQGVDPEYIGEGLKATAWDGCGVVEGLECDAPERFVLGVQWHPERIRDAEHRRRLFAAFIRACRRAECPA